VRVAIPTATPAARDRNENIRPDVDSRCFVCGRPAETLWIRTAQGTQAVTADEAVPADADSGWWPIGSECARKLGKAYVFTTEEMTNRRESA
jgi:hypothetical protein